MYTPKTKSQIKKEAKQIEKALRKLYTQLDVLIYESEIAAQGCTDKQISLGKADEFNEMANILQSSRDNAELAYDDLQSINP